MKASHPQPVLASLALCAMMAACSPALNWRRVQPADGDLEAMFPCRPEQVERAVPLTSRPTTMHLTSCAAAGLTFSLTGIDADDVASVPAMLATLQSRAVSNVGGVASPFAPASIASSLPLPLSPPLGQGIRVRIVGKLPDGRPVVEDALFFAHGRRVHQATILSPTGASAEVAETFFTAMRVR